MKYKRIAHSVVARLPTNIENVSMSYLNRVIGERTKSSYDFGQIKQIIINDYMNKNKTYKKYHKGGN
ncbi:hypothetical protein RM652_13065 [Mammaliicoccus sciuri]|uniref:hypothetical protein n=1 Tax=Mammaliicoccus sciuri TaxID=1296 RepID=UPI002885E350|nr:hypothetical protein [Mammaliicoccus sciuri]MDT0704053.1 hypothetical protein [Mammaliicoccus sciuri]